MKDLICNYLEPISYFILTLAFGFALKSNRSIKIWVLFTYFFLATIIMASASFDVGLQIPNNSKYDLLLLLMSVSLSYYFFATFQSRIKKVFAALVAIFFLLNYIMRDMIFHANHLFDSLGFGLFCLSVTTMTFFYFNQILINVSNKSILLIYGFWINSGFLIYYLPSSVIHLSIYTLTKMYGKFTVSQNYIWGAQNIVLFLSAICISSGVIWIYYQKK